MQTLGWEEESTEKAGDQPEPKKGFWRRQFQQEPTRAQKIFDWIFGVAMPAICFYFDPIVFQQDGIRGMYQYKIGVYLLTYISIMGLAAWLIWKGKLGWLLGPLSGLLAAGSLIALAIGIIILPLSVIGLIFVIGVLGFTPLFTSIIYARNALRATRAAGPFLGKQVAIRAMVLSGMFALVVPYVINVATTTQTLSLSSTLSETMD